MLLDDGTYYIFAEYNPFWIYGGWWLYAIPCPDGEIKDRRDMKWLQTDWAVNDLRAAIGLPKLRDLSKSGRQIARDAANEFILSHPIGVLISVRDSRWEQLQSDCLPRLNRDVRKMQLKFLADEDENAEASEGDQGTVQVIRGEK